MDMGNIRRVVALNARLEEAEARKVCCACRITDLMNSRCRNEAARLQFLDRAQSDLYDIIIEIGAIKEQLAVALLPEASATSPRESCGFQRGAAADPLRVGGGA